MPVHGEWRHLRANAELGALTGVPKDHIVIAEDGVVVDLVDGRAKIVGKVQAGYVYVDGLSVGDVTETSLKDRRILGEEGIISVFIVVDSSSGKITGGPDIHARGSGIDDSAFSAVVPKIEEAINRSAQDGVLEPHQVQQLVRRTVGKWVSDTYHAAPDDPSGRRRGLTPTARTPERGPRFASGRPAPVRLRLRLTGKHRAHSCAPSVRYGAGIPTQNF